MQVDWLLMVRKPLRLSSRFEEFGARGQDVRMYGEALGRGLFADDNIECVVEIISGGVVSREF